MAKISAKYKVIYIIDPAQGEEGIAALVEKFKAMVEAEGTLVSLDELGKRRLAYPINDLPEGYYVRMICQCPPQSFQATRIGVPSARVSRMVSRVNSLYTSSQSRVEV